MRGGKTRRRRDRGAIASYPDAARQGRTRCKPAPPAAPAAARTGPTPAAPAADAKRAAARAGRAFDASTDGDRPQLADVERVQPRRRPVPRPRRPTATTERHRRSPSRRKDGDVHGRRRCATPDGFVVVQLKQHKTATRDEFEKDRETLRAGAPARQARRGALALREAPARAGEGRHQDRRVVRRRRRRSTAAPAARARTRTSTETSAAAHVVRLADRHARQRAARRRRAAAPAPPRARRALGARRARASRRARTTASATSSST